MAWGGYGRNSPDYPATSAPYQPVPTPAPTPVTGPSAGSAGGGTSGATSGDTKGGSGGKQEFCPGCGERAEARFICCPYCRHDLQAARERRLKTQCLCGQVRLEGDNHCFSCGQRRR